MSIKSICKLQNYGIFKSFNNKDVNDFGKYNLIYGWNGSGKSTLTDVLRCIELHSKSTKFPSAKFEICTDGDRKITEENISDSDLNIYTFNQEFIRENISWNSIVKSILIVDKQKIDERKKLNELKIEQEKDTNALRKKSEEIKIMTDQISKFETDSARHMKASLQSIDTTDNYYLNYDKRKFRTFVEENNDKMSLTSSLLNEKNIIEFTNAAKPVQKPNISFAAPQINVDDLNKAHGRLNGLLSENVISQTIKKLTENSDIKDWVEKGLNLHRNHNSKKCEFCDNIISDIRLKELEGHFNDNYKIFQERLDNANKWIEDQFIKMPNCPSPSDLYDELKQEYKVACNELESAVKKTNNEIEKWRETLHEKTKNQHKVDLSVEFINESSIQGYCDAAKLVSEVVTKHNSKTNNFKEETNKAKRKLELHFAVTEVKSFDYDNKALTIEELQKDKDELNRTIGKRLVDITDLENTLSNEGLGAYEFNECLHKFLGRSELTLRFNSLQKGYEILRDGSFHVEGKLSEGEKTAIAFTYFITKLKENDNKIEKTIVVVDDPVSSFDSNHLFHAYSFLRTQCTTAKQLFVFTHNFTYYKLIRDWFNGININRNRKNPPKTPIAFFYTIESDSSNIPRTSQIFNADDTLIKYHSEYHYIFSKLFKYKDQERLNRDEAFLTANLSRKLLESFFSFKYPKCRSDLSQLMTCGLHGCQRTDENIKEKIYRFINKYSHSIVIEVNEDSSENLVGESQSIINDIFEWMKEVDVIHYNEMLEVIEA